MKANLFSRFFEPKNKAHAILVLFFCSAIWAFYFSCNHHCLKESLELLHQMKFVVNNFGINVLKSWLPLFFEYDLKRSLLLWTSPSKFFLWIPKINLAVFLIVSVVAAVTIGYPVEEIITTLVKDILIGKLAHFTQHHIRHVINYLMK